MLLSGTNQWNYLIPQLRQLTEQYMKSDMPIAVTAINTSAPGQQAPAQGVAALWWADTLATLMDQQVNYAAFSSAAGINEPYPLFTVQGQQQTQTPMLRVMQIFSHLQNNLIPVQTQRDPISMYATQDNAHQTVSLLFINKSNTAQLAQISSTKSVFVCRCMAFAHYMSIAAYSMVVMTLHRNGGAEAYSYVTPTVNDSASRRYSIRCVATKSNTLASNIPCSEKERVGVFLNVLGLMLEGLYLLVILGMTVQAIFNIRLRLYIWEIPEHAWLNHTPTIYRDPCLSFTILLPAQHEEEVYRETIQKVYDLNYPSELKQILAICREDDPETIAEAQAEIDELGDPNVQLVIFNDFPINKPHGLNIGLQVSRGDVVAIIFDAEDQPASRYLEYCEHNNAQRRCRRCTERCPIDKS